MLWSREGVMHLLAVRWDVPGGWFEDVWTRDERAGQEMVFAGDPRHFFSGFPCDQITILANLELAFCV